MHISLLMAQLRGVQSLKWCDHISHLNSCFTQLFGTVIESSFNSQLENCCGQHQNQTKTPTANIKFDTDNVAVINDVAESRNVSGWAGGGHIPQGISPHYR